MDHFAAYQASNETPAGTQFIYPRFDESGKYYECHYTPDVVYAEYGDVKRTLQIIRPRRPGAPLPCVVYVRGAGWQQQDVYAQIPSVSYVATCGIVVACVEVRGTDLVRFPQPLEDVKCAIRFLRANAETYHIDPENIAVWGDSSGGHLALMTGLTIGKYNNGLYAEQSDSVKAVISYYGISDLLTLGKYNDFVDHDSADTREAALLGVEPWRDPELAKQASPFYQDMEQYLPAFMLVHGDSDRVIHVNQSVEMYKKLQQYGHRAVFYRVVGADHGSGVWGRQMLDLTERFLSSHLQTPMTQPAPGTKETK